MRGRSLTPSRLVRTELRAAGTALIMLGLVVLVTTAATVAWPRVSTAVLSSDLAFRVTAAAPGTRDLQAQLGGVPIENSYNSYSNTSMTSTWPTVPSLLAHQQSLMTPTLRAVTGDGRYVGRAEGTSLGILASGPPKQPSDIIHYLSIEGNPLLRSDAVLVKGSWPAITPTIPSSTPVPVAMSAAAAKFIHWKIGQTQQIGISRGRTQTIVLTGLVAPRTAHSDYWDLDLDRNSTGLSYSPDGSYTYYHNVVWVNSGSWPAIAPVVGDDEIDTWFPVQGAALSADNLSAVQVGLQSFLAKPTAVGGSPFPRTLQYSSQLQRVLNDYVARAGPANTLLTIFATGPLGVAFALLLLSIRLLVDRRRPALLLLRARGASDGSLRRGIATLIIVPSTIAALLGGCIGYLLAPGGFTVSTVVFVAIGIVAPPAIAAASLSLYLGGETTQPRRRWRLVSELVVLVLASLALVLVSQKGISAAGNPFAPDPLVVLAPLLLVVATCLVVLRVYPILLRWVGRLLRRGRASAAFLGWAEASRTRAGLGWPLFALLTGVAITLFSLAFVTTENTGLTESAYSSVGGDISVSGYSIPASVLTRLKRMPGVTHSAIIRDLGSPTVQDSNLAVEVYSANAHDLAAVESDAPPLALSHFPVTGTGIVPAIGGGIGKQTTLHLGLPSSTGANQAFTVRASVLPYSPIETIKDPAWLVIDSSRLPATDHIPGTVSAILLSVKPGTNVAALALQAKSIAGSGAAVDTAAAEVASYTAPPIVGGFEGLAIAAGLLAALLCLVALVVTLVMKTSARTRLVGTLTTLGLSRRQSLVLVAWEIGPIALIGTVVGGFAGLVLPGPFLAAIDLTQFAGGLRPALSLDPALVAAALVGYLVLGAIAGTIAGAVSLRTSPATILRERGDE